MIMFPTAPRIKGSVLIIPTDPLYTTLLQGRLPVLTPAGQEVSFSL